MKKIFLILIGALMVLAFATKPASAYVIDWLYTWYSTGGTYAYNALVPGDSFVSGNIEGTPLLKIEEKYTSDLGEFMYDISNIRPDHNIYGISKWELNNPLGIVADSVTSGPIGTGWNVVISSSNWTWSTPNYNESADGQGIVGNFGVYTGAPRGLVTGTVYYADANGNRPILNPTASGIVSGPVPEPSSMMLLGLGVLGLFGLKRRKVA